MPAKLPKPLLSGPFTPKQANKYKLSFYQLQILVKSGEIEQISRGVYRVPQTDLSEIDQFRIATLIVGKPAAICLLSALSYYGLTDLIPKKTWVLVPNSKRTQSKEVKLFRMRNPHWTVGICNEEEFRITSIERTLVEAIVYKRILGSSTAMEALKVAIKNKKVTLGKIIDMAKKLGCLHRVLPVVEVLA